jgi:hypothetical protein
MPRRVGNIEKTCRFRYEEIASLEECDDEFIESLKKYSTYDDLKSTLLLSRTHRLLLFCGSKLCAVSAYTRGKYTLSIIWLVSSEKDCGYGSIMVEYFKDMAKKLKLSDIMLTPVEGTEQFYINRGFKKHLGGKMIYIL